MIPRKKPYIYAQQMFDSHQITSGFACYTTRNVMQTTCAQPRTAYSNRKYQAFKQVNAPSSAVRSTKPLQRSTLGRPASHRQATLSRQTLAKRSPTPSTFKQQAAWLNCKFMAEVHEVVIHKKPISYLAILPFVNRRRSLPYPKKSVDMKNRRIPWRHVHHNALSGARRNTVWRTAMKHFRMPYYNIPSRHKDLLRH